MSTELSLPQFDEALAYLEAEASACWNKVLDAVFGSIGFPEVPHPAPAPEDTVWFAYDFTPQLGSSFFGLNRTTAIALGHHLLCAKRRPTEHDHHAIHATGHLVGQLASSLAMSMSSRLKTTIRSAESLNSGDPAALPHTLTVAFRETERSSHSLFVRPSTELVGALGSPFSTSNAGDRPDSPCRSRNLELLLDVQMPVSISFGTTRLPLKEVAKLSPGSVIELDRSLSEPIQVLVNNCSIARAEVVVVDGKFGIRIKEIMSRQDRLRSLA